MKKKLLLGLGVGGWGGEGMMQGLDVSDALTTTLARAAKPPKNVFLF